MIGCLWSLYLHIYFFDAVRNKPQTMNIYTKIDKKKIKSSKKEYVILTNEKHFPKTINQGEFDYGLFTNLPIIIFACNFSPSSFKVKIGILLLLTKKVS